MFSGQSTSSFASLFTSGTERVSPTTTSRQHRDTTPSAALHPYEPLVQDGVIAAWESNRAIHLRGRAEQEPQSLKLVQAELNLTEPLVARGAAGKVEALRLRRQVSDLQGKIDEVHNDYTVRTHEEQVKNSAELDAQLQVAAGREDQLTRTALLSPVYGIVKAIAITTPGGVVEPGGKLMEIVPLEDRLLIETRVAPRDIAWIRAGLPATVKITAYDTAIYGDLPGIVESVSPDTLQDSDLREPPYFRVYVRTQTATLTSRRGQRFPVLPGMLADVEIKTGQKSVLDYLLKPLNKAAEALRER